MYAKKRVVFVFPKASNEFVGFFLNLFGPFEVLLKVNVLFKYWKSTRSARERQHWKLIAWIFASPFLIFISKFRIIAERTVKLVRVEINSETIPVRSERIALFGVASV
jgi:hypothetical protein